MRKKENINQRIQYAGSIIHSVQNRIRRHKISNRQHVCTVQCTYIHVVERFLVARLYTYRWSSVHKTISYAQIGSVQKVLFIELIVANWNPFDLL